MSGRPLDVLEAAVGDEVDVRLKSGETYRGTLAGYDQHMNLVLDDAVASSGDGGAGSPGDGTASEAEDDAAAVSGTEGSSEETADSGAETPADGRDTTIIRGDNVVSITP
jgi:small nuclear ribonucleoprotein